MVKARGRCIGSITCRFSFSKNLARRFRGGVLFVLFADFFLVISFYGKSARARA